MSRRVSADSDLETNVSGSSLLWIVNLVAMYLGVVSDTHGQVDSTRPGIEALRAYEVEVVLHCGDVGSPEIVPLFDDWPTHFVFGNVDEYRPDRLREAIAAAGQTCHGPFGSLELAGTKIALLHGHEPRRFRETVTSDEWDLVCYGHTHVAEHHYEGNTLVLNPGALYRATPHSLAVVELPSLNVVPIQL